LALETTNLNELNTKIHSLSDDPDFKLIAIASHLNDYKISWLFNEELKYKFKQTDDLIVSENKNQTNVRYTVFVSENETDSTLTLYTNRCGNNILLKSLKNIDYILKCQGYFSNYQLVEFIEKIKKLKNILTVYQIDLTSFKPKEIEVFV
jgi:aminopeptidase-like protein